MNSKAALRFALSGLIILAFSTLASGLLQREPSSKEPGKTVPFRADGYEKAWKKADSLERIGLPQSALAIVQEIYKRAKKEGQKPQYIKSILYKLKLQARTDENAFVNSIAELKEEINQAKSPERQILHSIIGDIYWQHYSQNRYLYINRSVTLDFDNDNIATWDLNKIVSECIQHYQASLSEPEVLKREKIDDYQLIINPGRNNNDLRKTVYEFLAHRAIDFFSGEEPQLIKPADQFTLNDTLFLKPIEEFINIPITTIDSLSFKFYAIRLFQEVSDFQLDSKNASSLVDLDLKRLDFVRTNSTHPLKDSVYLQTLRLLEKKTFDDPASVEVSHAIANVYYEKGLLYNPQISEEHKWDLKKAMQICNDALKRNGDAVGNSRCKELIAQIKSKTLSSTVEVANLPNKPFRSLISYKNVDSIHFRIYSASDDDLRKIYRQVQKEEYRRSEEEILLEHFRKKQFVQSFSYALPNDNDHQTHSAEVKMPALPHGEYLIMGGTSKKMSLNREAIIYDFVSATDISYVNRTLSDGSTEFYFLNRTTGKPIPFAEARLFYEDYNRITGDYQMSEGYPSTADENGYLKYSPADRNFYLKIVNGKDFFYTSSLNSYPRNPGFYQRTVDGPNAEKSQLKTFYFTDRSIYRPGQTVYFKGIVLKTHKNNQHEIVKKQKVTVEFKDVNYQKITDLKLVSNDYGTFSGTFTAPANGLNGQMSITDNISGSHSVLVEDYKRPKFEVALADSKESYRLEDSVHVTGIAKAFAGSNISSADVKYRVVRNAVFPMWWYYWKGYYPTSPAMEIANGATKTDDKGEFKISFKAIPDLSVSRESKPTYNYTLYADVIDLNGETRSTEKTISVSYLALSLAVDLPTTLFKDELKPSSIRTTNLAGEFTSAEGTITIHKLESPKRILRNRQWPVPDKHLMKEEEFVQLFPNDPYKDESNFLKWPKQKLVYEKNFNTSKNKNFDLKEAENWEQGKYMLVIKAKDKFGEEVKEVVYFTLIDKKSNETALKETDWFTMLKSTGEPGEKALLMIGTAAEEINVLFEVEHDNAIVRKEWIVVKKQQRLLEIPIEEKYRGNFGIHLTYISNNEIFKHSETITVPFTNKSLAVSFETFRNKLQPGEKESWKLRVKGPNGEKVAAEMVATLYDASLNAFSANNFNFDIYNTQYTRLNWNSTYGFITSNGRLYQKNWNPSFAAQVRTYDQLNWFGFSIYYFSRSIQQALQGRVPGVRIRGVSTFNQSSTGEANGVNISGRVTDESGEALPGVNVMIKGTNFGTATDLDGRFNIKAASNRVLVFSFIGYVSQEVSLGGKTTLNVKLEEDIQRLSEVVVGYNTESDQEYNPQKSLRAPKLADSAKEESIVPQKKDVAGNTALKEDLVAVKTRTNFNETAFFYPHLETDENGDILINFTIPEALTKWKMLGFAHTQDLKFAVTENELITQKELMVVPNVPRFFREGDQIIFSTKITNLAEKDLKGETQLLLFDALTMKPVDDLLKNKESIRAFETKKGQSTQVSWSLSIPEGLQAITYKVVARAGNFSDGEEKAVPVLTNRMLVTETLPLPIRSNQNKTFTLDKLVNNASSTLRNHKLTLEFTSQPAWYAIQALPYLMEFPYECAEQTFSRFYANSIATHIANSDPKIKAVFDSWKSTANSTALLSNLEKNQELKSLMLEETPWVQDAQNETERKNRIALLFDLNKMSMELEKALGKLRKMQTSYGAWPWFEGMEPSRYITQHIVTGLGHLDHLKIKNIRENREVWAMATSAIRYLDKQIVNDYEALKKDEKRGLLKMSDNHLHGEIIQYLYARSYFKDIPMSDDLKTAANYYSSQGKTYWMENNRYCQAMIALALHRMEDKTTPSAILKSLKENAIVNEEMGMYWKETWGYYWWEAPVETQALLVEAFDEVANDQKAVDDMKVWLLKQKQTQNWQTTKATTEACYALLLRGTNWLASDALVEISLGNKKIDPTKLEGAKPEAGTGYFKTSFAGSEVTNEMGKVTVSKKDEGVSWGAIYWQYFEQLDKITPHETPLTIRKQLFIEKNTDKGPVISPVKENTKLKVGDLLKVRIELVVDRDMEYVHMKDMRASGFEPLNVLSGYKYQDGLGYYESTRDAATNFFFDHLKKGTYVFEYPLRVTHKGDFSNGITSIQSMYAPEFSSHSEGVRVKVE